MKTKIALALFSVLLLTVSVSVPGAKPSKTKLKLRDFRITNQLEGWQENRDSFIEFKAGELYGIINGGADEYIEHGLKRGIYQSLKSREKFHCEVFVEDFEKEKTALKFFNRKKGSVSQPVPLGKAKGNIKNIAADEVLGGINIYMNINQYYFEIVLNGFQTADSATASAGDFLSFYNNLLNM
jgi:hypothetical protein